MSVPPAWIAQVPPLTDWLPARAGLPISAQLQPVRQLTGTLPVLTFTLLKTMVLSVLKLCDIAARPARTGPAILIVTLEPATSVQVLPSEEHTSELQSHLNLVCRLLLEKKKKLHSAEDCPHRRLKYNTTTPLRR